MKDNIQKIVIYFYLNVAMLFYYGIMHSYAMYDCTHKHIKVPNGMAKIVLLEPVRLALRSSKSATPYESHIFR